MTQQRKGPVLVTCARAPPQVGGTPTVMYELLRRFPKGSVVLVGKHPVRGTSSDDRVLDVPKHEIARAGANVYPTLFQLLILPLTFIELVRVAARVRPSSILAVFPSLDMLACSHVLAALLRVPIRTYLHDCIVETAANPAERVLARRVERWTFERSETVYSMSGPMMQYYSERGRASEVLPHGLDPSLAMSPKPSPRTGAVRVGFSGAIYEYNLQAIRDRVDASGPGSARVELHITCPAQSASLLRSAGLAERIASVRTLPTRRDVVEFLSSCDVLFIPMSFESKVRGDLLTIFPTKITDYWLAGRPIVVYGPEEYRFVPLAEAEGYALCVKERDAGALVSAIERAASVPEVRDALVQASARMVERHDADGIARRLMADLAASGAKA